MSLENDDFANQNVGSTVNLCSSERVYWDFVQVIFLESAGNQISLNLLLQ